MASFICCGSRRRPSPDLGPSRLVDNTQTRGRFSLSTDVSPAISPDAEEAEASVHKIFQAAEGNGGFPRSNGSAKPTNRHKLERGESIKKIQDVANRVRISMSRDSGISMHTSYRARDSIIDDNMRLQRVQHNPSLANPHHGVPEGSEFDEDAIAIKTSKNSWGREQDSHNDGNLRSLKETMNNIPLPQPAPHHKRSSQDISRQLFVQETPAAALSRMLTTRSRSMQASSHEADRKEEAEQSNQRRSTSIKYIFRDESPEKPSIRTPSPLGRSDTVIRSPSSTAVVDLGRPTFLNSFDSQLTPEPPSILQQRMESIHDSGAGREWRLSFAPSNHEGVDLRAADDGAPEEYVDAVEDNSRSLRVTPESWTRGGPFRAPIYHRQVPDDRTNKDPASESMSHGIATADSATAEEHTKVKSSDKRKHSSGSESVHLYNMRIPYQLASKTLLSLQDSGQSDDLHLVEDGTANADVKRPASREIPLAWNLPKKYAASSVYSRDSHHATPSHSNKSSIMCLNKIADRMNKLGPDAPAQDIISVPPMGKQVNLTQLEDASRDTSFHSSNESFTERELAAAELRIMPRAKTMKVPKNTWFKEDFDEVAAALSKTNPLRRAVSQKVQVKPDMGDFDGSGEHHHHHLHHLSLHPRIERFSSVVGGDSDASASIWEKALWEHEEEDQAISRTRAGSDPRFADQHSLQRRHHKSLDPRKPPPHRHLVDRFSAEHKAGEFIKARLEAFQLPTSPGSLSPLDEPPKPAYSPNSYPSWKRYPSHTRKQRSSASAGDADNIITRDFAEEAASAARLASLANDDTIDPAIRLQVEADNETASLKASRKSKSMNFGCDALSKLQKLYRATSLDFASKTAYGSRGHRSSVSEGWAAEYPELEMLPPGDSTLGGFDGAEGDRGEVGLNPWRRVGSRPGANKWSRMYVEECVVWPVNSPSGSVEIVGLDRGVDEVDEGEGKALVIDGDADAEGPRSAEAMGRIDEVIGSSGSETRCDSGSDGDVRKSTLDFKRSLEVLERQERERILDIAVGITS